MTHSARNPLLYTWLSLAAATLLSWWLGSQNAGTATAVVISLIAIVKCRLVLRSYMEVRFAPSWLQLTCDAWLILNFGIVTSLYWL